jgi:pimeloyl-ACP methyl ester carboxylesterase
MMLAFLGGVSMVARPAAARSACCVALASAVLGCTGTLRAPAELALGEPTRFEAVTVATPVVEHPGATPDEAPKSVAVDVETWADVGILLLQGKLGSTPERHPIECVMYEGAFARGEGDAAGGPRGVCIVVPGLLGTHSAGHLVEALLEDRWVVAVVWPPLVDRARESMRKSAGKSAGVRGAALAGSVDVVIENAGFVAQAALIKLHARRPALKGKPVILVGESMGAMAGVGMAATGKVPFDAALFVAGGGDLIAVARGSSLRGFFDVDRLAGDAAFGEAFRAACERDPLRAAESLRGGPVAIITAADDDVVPSATQEALWRAMGEPPRYTWDAGHFELFWRAEETVVPVVRAIAELVGDRSRAVEVLYNRTSERITAEEAERRRKSVEEMRQGARGNGGKRERDP